MKEEQTLPESLPSAAGACEDGQYESRAPQNGKVKPSPKGLDWKKGYTIDQVIGRRVRWRVSGYRPNHLRIRKRFAAYEEAYQSREDLILEDENAEIRMKSRQTELTVEQLQDAEQACRLLGSPSAQAFAMPGIRKLLFTERLLQLLSDDEVAAVCAHELAHLTESAGNRYSRSIQMLAFLPWIYFTPLTQACRPNFGFVPFFGLLFITIGMPGLYRKISRKLESRADAMAQVNEGDAGTYARALERLYADNLVPAVTAKPGAHPHLYDRLLAAGVTPDFPRPVAAISMAWHGQIFAGLIGALFAIFAIQQMQIYGPAF